MRRLYMTVIIDEKGWDTGELESLIAMQKLAFGSAVEADLGGNVQRCVSVVSFGRERLGLPQSTQVCMSSLGDCLAGRHGNV
jgi:hypothetical protein